MHLYLPLFAASLASASQWQQPLFNNDNQAHLSKKELVNTNALQADITQDNLLKRAKDLYSIAELGIDEYNHPTRVIGSKGIHTFSVNAISYTHCLTRRTGHLGTINYIYHTLTNLNGYYNVTNQTFPAVVGNVFESRLVLNSTVPESATAMALTPPTKAREPVYGPLIHVKNDGCHSSDYPSDVEGGIAFIKRGVCAFGVKSANAGKAGATAAVIYNTEYGSLSGTLGTPKKHHVATFGLSKADAAPFLKTFAEGGEVDASAYIDAIVQSIGTKNIIAQTVDGDPDNCVMLGGHSDSVAEGPGINDDGSGSMALLEIASQLAQYRVNNCVRFAWWAGEEEGLLGSDWYVAQLEEEENMKIRMFMDYDMLGSPNFAYQVCHLIVSPLLLFVETLGELPADNSRSTTQPTPSTP